MLNPIPFLAHSDEERDSMVHSLGLEKIDELFNDIPRNLNIKFQIFPSITSAESRILLYDKNIL